MKKETVVIFSHGFGVRQDARGLFTDIADVLHQKGIKTVLFDYNKYDEDTKELFAIPFSEQAKLLQNVIDDTHAARPNAEIIIIGHSQGCIIPCLCNIMYISRIILLGPFFHTHMNEVIERYTKDSTNTLNLTGMSLRKRSDGSTTIIPATYWKERFATNVIDAYNKLAIKKDVYIIYGLQDQIMQFESYKDIKNCFIMNIDADHDFSFQHREGLIDKIIPLII